MSRHPTVATAAGLLAIAISAGADTRLSIHSIEPGKEPQRHSVLVAGGKVRMEAEAALLLYDQAANTFFAIQTEEKSYMELDPDSTGAMMDQVNQMRAQMMAQLQEQLAEMPEAQREQMIEIMKRSGQVLPDAPPETVRYESGIGPATVAGVPCRWVRAYEGRTKVRELCMASPSSMGFASDDASTMRAMQTSIKAMSDRIGAAGAGFFRDDMPDGFPIHVRHFDGQGSVTMEQIVEGVTSESIDPSVFAVPEGYRKQELPQTRP